MTGVDVEHTKALEAAATPGEWHYELSAAGTLAIFSGGLSDTGIHPAVIGYRGEEVLEADARFIAHARTVVPALVAAFERVQAIADELLATGSLLVTNGQVGIRILAAIEGDGDE